MTTTWRFWLLSGPALTFYALVLLVPLGLTALLSLQTADPATGAGAPLGLHNYAEVLSDSYFLEIFVRTLALALVTTIACLLLGVPEAIILHRMRAPWRGLFLLVILGPLLIAVVVRTLGWALVFGPQGVLGAAGVALGWSREPVSLMYTSAGVTIALVHVLVPFMVVAVWAALQRGDAQAEHAAASLGAGGFTIFRRILLPRIVPGIASGSVVVFSLAATAFATPAIIGGRRLKVAATAAQDEFLATLNWPLGAAIAVILLVGNLGILLAYDRLVKRRFAESFR
ncbi:ABC transporter permease [Roseomonas sp. CECT 9278]|uniref:ABC transporter permease n=1 Tax=Roseomonas sp. CECT 9278 TaxID=2845823 RepID=UPI001E4EF0FF|nr:ABC transporter permease [Roseomonas sp. CECT 9278]CAH0161476.1 Spermidine/putrescine transport system permease protein PotB [Roseomonas sp. CECT 9278]